MPRTVATTRTVELAELLDLVRTRHHVVLVTRRSDGEAEVLHRPEVRTGGFPAEVAARLDAG